MFYQFNYSLEVIEAYLSQVINVRAVWCRFMRQILKSLPPVVEMLIFLMFFMLLFSMLGLSNLCICFHAVFIVLYMLRVCKVPAHYSKGPLFWKTIVQIHAMVLRFGLRLGLRLRIVLGLMFGLGLGLVSALRLGSGLGIADLQNSGLESCTKAELWLHFFGKLDRTMCDIEATVQLSVLCTDPVFHGSQGQDPFLLSTEWCKLMHYAVCA